VKKHKKEHVDEQVQSQEAQKQDKESIVAEHDSESAELQEKLAAKEKEAADNYDKYLRAIAELDNYKKRAAREKTEILKYGKEDVINDILPFVDSLDRALEHAGSGTDIQAFAEGLKLIQDQLLCGLKKHGVEVIECAGKEFDPNYHEAMMQIESEQHTANKIINEFQRGYLLNGRLLRPSRVSVCKKINNENNVDELIVENGE